MAPLLGQLEASLLDVIEHILTRHVVKHDVVLVAAIEDVNELDDIGVLAHLEHLDFTTLLEHFDRLHVGLFHSLDCNLLARFQVRTKLHQTELPLTKSVRQLVIFIDIREVDGV